MAKLVLVALILGICATIPALPTNEELCEPDLCKRWIDNAYHFEHNIGCDNDGAFGPACPEDVELVDISDFVDMILDLHNSHRNTVASGDLDRFDPAARMAQMTWSKTLQYMAELNCKTCNYAHDKCRNTPDFPYAGQNIGETRTTPDPKKPKEIIEKIFHDWFKENKYANMADIRNFTGSHGEVIGHFTQSVQDHANAIGCGLIKFIGDVKGREENIGYFVCNYAMSNVDDQPIYEAGTMGSGCESGMSTEYTGLCSTSEVYNLDTLVM